MNGCHLPRSGCGAEWDRVPSGTGTRGSVSLQEGLRALSGVLGEPTSPSVGRGVGGTLAVAGEERRGRDVKHGPSPCPDPTSLSAASRADPVRDIRCEFCGEYFENRKGLSSHARSHLRQMGVTEWSVNGSPIDTLREILKKKSKPCVIKKEPHASSIEPPKSIGEEGTDPKSPGKILQGLALPPLGGRTGKPSPGSSTLNREISLSPLTSKPQGSFLTPLSAKRPLQDDRLGPHAEVKHKAYIQTELPFKTKSVHDKPAHTCKWGMGGGKNAVYHPPPRHRPGMSITQRGGHGEPPAPCWEGFLPPGDAERDEGSRDLGSLLFPDPN